MLDKNKILIGISGGIDSAVSAYLLKEMGYEVIGYTMHLWDSAKNSRHYEDVIKDAAKVCSELGIKHIIKDNSEVFKKEVIGYFVDEYMNGRTPNPCIFCNRHIKWPKLLEVADQNNCYYIATGHYAKIDYNKDSKRYEIIAGEDRKKDQSYFLYQLTQEQLARTKIPLYEISKDKVREIAAEIGLFNKDKKDSQEICFIEDNNYKNFLKAYSKKKILPGDMYSLSGENLKRKHEGFPFYTIGQRKGLGGGFSQPMFVGKIDKDQNRVYVGTKEQIVSQELFLKNFNWVSISPVEKLECMAKVRFNTAPVECVLTKINAEKYKLSFAKPIFAVTPGQAGVLYIGNKLIGGGIIE